MRKSLALAALCFALAGCTLQHGQLSSVQFNQSTIPFPDNYQSEAAYAVLANGGNIAASQVSRPLPLVGATSLSPQRWYACIAGLVPRTPEPERLPYPAELLDTGRYQGPGPRPYHLVLIFNGSGRPATRPGFDAPLCRAVSYERITAEPPLI